MAMKSIVEFTPAEFAAVKAIAMKAAHWSMMESATATVESATTTVESAATTVATTATTTVATTATTTAMLRL